MARKPKNKRQVMDRSKWRKKKEEQETKRKGSSPIQLPDGIEFLSIKKKGVRHLDLIPYEVTDKNHPAADVGDLYYCRPFRMHRNVGPDNHKIICPSTWGNSCPICKEREKLKADEADDDAVKRLNASERGLYVIQDHNDDEGKIYVFEQGMWAKGGTHGFGQMLEAEIGYQDEDDALPWDWDGPTLKVRFGVDTFMKNEFYPVEKIDLKDEGKEVNPDILDDVPDLDACLVQHSYEAIENLFYGVEDGDDDGEDDDDDDKPVKNKKNSPKDKRKNKKEVEEEEVEEEEVDPDEFMDVVKDFDPDEVDFDEKDEVTEARDSLLEAADGLKIDISGIPKTLTGWNNDTEKGLLKLQKAIIKLMDAPAKKDKTSTKKDKAKKTKNKCPHGHTFGDDWEEEDDCENCDVEEECGNAE